MALRPELQAFVDKLLSLPSRSLGLDEVAEVIGAAAITAEEIGEVFDALEAHGRSVGAGKKVDLEQNLRLVLRSARGLAAELGRKPGLVEIAERAGLSANDVRVALLFADVLSR